MYHPKKQWLQEDPHIPAARRHSYQDLMQQKHLELSVACQLRKHHMKIKTYIPTVLLASSSLYKILEQNLGLTPQSCLAWHLSVHA